MANFQRKQSRRPRRQIKPRHIIFVEGDTEKAYFNALIQMTHQVVIKVIKQKNPNDMLKEAKKIITSEWHKGIDRLWFLLDCEEPNHRCIPAYYSCLTQLRANKPKLSIQVCLSNVCFETWLLAHFQEGGLHQNAKQLQNALTKAIGHDYQKGSNLKSSSFTPHLSQALTNSELTATPLSEVPSRGSTHIPHLIKDLQLSI